MSTGRNLAYLLAAIVATVACFAGSDLLGPAGLFGVMLTPFPAAYLHLRAGRNPGGLTVLGSVALVLAIATPAAALQYLVLFGLGSFLLPVLLRRGIPWDRAWGATVLAVVSAAGPLVLLWARGREGTVSAQVRLYLEQEIQKAMGLYRQAEFSAEQLEELRRGGQFLLEVVPRVYPGLFVVSLGFLLLALVYLLARSLRGRFSFAGKPFQQWKTPEALVWGLILAGFAAFVPQQEVQTVAYNTLIVLLPLYFMQGMAVVSCFLARKGAPSFIRGLVCFLLVVVNPLPMVVTGVGLFDLWADFRKPKIKSA